NLKLVAVVRGGVGIELMHFMPNGQVTRVGMNIFAGASELSSLLQVISIKSEEDRRYLQSLKSTFKAAKSVGASFGWNPARGYDYENGELTLSPRSSYSGGKAGHDSKDIAGWSVLRNDYEK